MNRMDLHMHSTYSSDGTYTPTELMDLCSRAGLTTVSLTDHNSARGVQEAAADRRRGAGQGAEAVF